MVTHNKDWQQPKLHPEQSLYAYAWVDKALIFTRRNSLCNAQSFGEKQFTSRLMYST